MCDRALGLSSLSGKTKLPTVSRSLYKGSTFSSVIYSQSAFHSAYFILRYTDSIKTKIAQNKIERVIALKWRTTAHTVFRRLTRLFCWDTPAFFRIIYCWKRPGSKRWDSKAEEGMRGCLYLFHFVKLKYNWIFFRTHYLQCSCIKKSMLSLKDFCPKNNMNPDDDSKKMT